MKKKIIFREHKGSLDDSLKTLKKFTTLQEMLDYISIRFNINNYIILCDLYDNKPDVRIKWPNTYILFTEDIVHNCEILGFFTILRC